jgi:alpha-galactosidase
MKYDEGKTAQFKRNAHDLPDEVTRRSFLRTGGAVIGVLASASAGTRATVAAQDVAGAKQAGVHQAVKHTQKRSSFLDLLRLPDEVTAFERFDSSLPAGEISMTRSGEQWVGRQVQIQSRREQDALVLTLLAPARPLCLVHVRWRNDVARKLLVLGDAWERSYGDLGWRNVIPERVLPWYFATYDDSACHGYGVKTDAGALCFWQVDQHGVSLWLNVANGGNGVELGDRQLTMATVVSHRGADGVNAMESVRALCRAMCGRTSRPSTPIYGANDYCYAYGKSTAETILRDTEYIVGLSPSGGVRPFSVIDGGWRDGTAAWPDMGRLAGDIKQRGARPGIWIRPLRAPADADPGLLLKTARFGGRKDRASELAYDPTIPEAREKIRAKYRQVADWGYEMMKHDYSTYDLLGQWGFEMGPQPTLPGWSLQDRSRTNAEVIAEFHALMRKEVGDRILIDGCNTVGHLGQGFFDLQRTGDDTSGHHWERTRRDGVNTAAFRLPQQGTFYTLDADLAGITDAVPWEFNRQYVDMLARSGTATLVSIAPSQRGAEQSAALKESFQIASAGGLGATPEDWMETSAPERWRSASGWHAEQRYDWSGPEGTSPFLSP